MDTEPSWINSRELNRSYFDSLPGLAWLVDAQERCYLINRQVMAAFGLTHAEWLGKHAADVLPAPLSGAGGDRPLPVSEIVALPDNNRPRYFLLSRFPVRTANDTMTGAFAFDLSDWITLERGVVAARDELFGYERARLIDRFSSGLAHNLNNKLNAIRLRLSSLGAERGLCRDGYSLKWLSKQLDDAAVTVQRLQKSARIEWDRPLAELDLSAVIAEAISLVEAYKQGHFDRTRRGSRFELEEVSPGASHIMGILPELLHLFVNLFLDADRLMASEATLRITLKEDDRRVTVTLAGQNRNFSSSLWAGLLNPFSSPENRYPIDLRSSMAESLIVRLGGSVEIVRTTAAIDDFGLKFSFPSARIAMPVLRRDRRQRKPCRNLLVVDDDPDNLEQMRTVLEMRGFTVITASSGFEALQTLDANRRVDSVLCDLGMPGMNGWDVATEIAHISPDTPVYLVTGWAETIPLADARRNLVEAVISKPINLEELERLLIVGERTI